MTEKIRFEVLIHPDANLELYDLNDKYQNSVLAKIKSLDFPFNIQFKHLEGNYYRFRSGNFRIIYQVYFEEKKVVVIKIGLRKNVYKKYKKK